MPGLETTTAPSFRFRYGDYEVCLGLDPFAETEPTRFVFLCKTWRRLKRMMRQMPAWWYTAIVASVTTSVCISAYYEEVLFLDIAAALVTLAGIFLVRHFRGVWGKVGLASILLGPLSFAMVQGMLCLPQVTRGLAVASVIAKGGEVRTFEPPEWGAINRYAHPLVGRDVVIADIMSVQGPLAAFPPRVVEDLHVPSNVIIQITRPQADNIDWSSHVRAIAPKSPFFIGSWWNEATVAGLTKSGLDCEVVAFNTELTPEQARWIASPRAHYQALRLHRLGPESFIRLGEANESGKPLGTIILTSCDLDARAAQALAPGRPTLVLDKSDADTENEPSLQELDDILTAGLNVRSVLAKTLNGDQAQRVARFPGLTTLTATLTDEIAVEQLSGSPLEFVYVTFANDAIVTSLMKYPQLGFVSFDVVEEPIQVMAPLVSNPNLFGLHIKLFRGTKKNYQILKSQVRLTISNFEEVGEDP